MTGRERIRAVVETLETSATVDEIADRAAVSPTTASDELAQLATDNRVRKVLVDNKKGYELNPTHLFFEELLTLLEEHSHTELEAQLEALRSEKETLCEEFDVDSVEMLREQVAERELTAEETKTIRNAISTWEGLNTDLTSSAMRCASMMMWPISTHTLEHKQRSPSTNCDFPSKSQQSPAPETPPRTYRQPL